MTMRNDDQTALSDAPEVISGTSLPEGWSLAQLSHADFDRLGQDLMITDADGDQLVIKGYFLQDQHADLTTNDGMCFRSEWVDRLSLKADKLAQAGESQKAPIGTVENVSGTVTVERADGSVITLQKGDLVYQNDIVISAENATIGIVFIDETTFSMSGDGKMILDEMVYDAAAEEGSANLSVLSGTFALISGQIAKTSPDALQVTTPSATIGFRGTSAAGQISPDGETRIILLADANGEVGEVSVTNQFGTVTLNQVHQGTLIADPSQPPSTATFFAPNFVNATFGGALAANPGAATYNPSNNSPGSDRPNQGAEGDNEGQADDTPQEDQQGGNNNDGGADAPLAQAPIITTMSEDALLGSEGNTLLDLGSILAAPGSAFDSLLLNLQPPPIGADLQVNPDHDPDTSLDELTAPTASPVIATYALSGSYNGSTSNDTMAFDADSGAQGTLSGLAGNDSLTGNSGDDFLDGGDGNDTLVDLLGGTNTLHGGSGNDTITVNQLGNNEIVGGAGTDTLDLSNANNGGDLAITLASNEISISFANANAITAQGIESLIGTTSNDNLTVDGGMTFDGGAGNDSLTVTNSSGVTVDMDAGSIAASTFDVNFSNVESLIFTDHNDTVNMNTTTFTGTVDAGNGDNTIVFSSAVELTDISATEFDVDLNGDSSADLRAKNFATIQGSDQADSFLGAKATNSIEGNGGDDVFYTTLATDTFDGGSDNDTFYISDTYSAIGGTDSIEGGTGTDLLSFASLTANPGANGITVDLSTPQSSYAATGTGNLASVDINFSGIEIIQFSDGSDTFTGSDAADTIITSSGTDELSSGKGDDTFILGSLKIDSRSFDSTLNGGDDNDTLDASNTLYTTEGATFTDGGTNTFEIDIKSDSTNDLFVEYVENILGTQQDDIFQNVALDGTINGAGGNDTFYASATDDTYFGSTGSDILYVSDDDGLYNGADTFVGGDGTDTLSFASLAGGNAANAMTLDLSGAAATTLDGVDLWQAGGTGIFSTLDVQFGQFEAYELTSGDDHFRGSDNAETITGNGGQDTLIGEGGDDVFIINSQSSNGTSISGGTGSNTIELDGLTGGTSTVVFTSEGTGTLSLPPNETINFSEVTTISLSTNGNNVTGSSSGETVQFNGGTASNISMNAGDDTVIVSDDAASGGSNLAGGDGADTIQFASSGLNAVSVNAATDQYRVISSTDDLRGVSTLSGFETFNLTTGNDDFIGSSSLNETVTAGKGNDLISYSGGSDNYTGGAGTDTLKLDIGATEHVKIDVSSKDLLLFNESDTLLHTTNIKNFEFYRMSQNDDTFIGGEDNDVVIGMGGADILTGDLTGDGGADTFAFSLDSASTFNDLLLLGLDEITDFTINEDSIAVDETIFDYDNTGLTIVSAADKTDGALDSNYGALSGHGIVRVENGSNTELWYVDELSDTSSNTYQFATLTGVTGTSDADIQSYTDLETLFDLSAGDMTPAVTAAGGGSASP